MLYEATTELYNLLRSTKGLCSVTTFTGMNKPVKTVIQPYTYWEYQDFLVKLGYTKNRISESEYNTYKVLNWDPEAPAKVIREDETGARVLFNYIGYEFDSPMFMLNSPIFYVKNDGKFRCLDHAGSDRHAHKWINFFKEYRKFAQSNGSVSEPDSTILFLLKLGKDIFDDFTKHNVEFNFLGLDENHPAFQYVRSYMRSGVDDVTRRRSHLAFLLYCVESTNIPVENIYWEINKHTKYEDNKLKGITYLDDFQLNSGAVTLYH